MSRSPFRLLLALPLLSLLCSAEARSTTPDHYLSDSGIDLVEILPPAPLPGSPRYDADRRTFRATRKLLGTPRGDEAVQDAREDVANILTDFSVAAGRTLSTARFPHLVGLLTKMRPDVSRAVNRAKDIWQRKRPFLIDRGPVCQPREQLEHSYDYPSGHTAWGTSVALVLAEVIPDRATPILARGRAYGDSRYVCGAHNLSAVDAGRWAAAAIVARLHGEPAFRRDLDALRDELAVTP